MAGDQRTEDLGQAHVATVSFLAARLAPSAQFWLSLGGGVALARASARLGLGRGYAASLAAMLQSVALIGPLRLNGPVTQALSAPLLGRLHARGARPLSMFLVCAAVRLTHYVVLGAFFIWVLLGGVDAFAASFDAVTGWVGFIPQGPTAALAITVAGYLAWTVFFSAVQVAVYRRALDEWPPDPPPATGSVPAVRSAGASGGRTRSFDPRALALAAAVAFVLLLASTGWWLLGGVAAWLAVAWLAARPEADIARVGLALALVLGLTTGVATLLGAAGADEAARRGVRAALLVLVATWLRGAAGPEGMSELFRRGLRRLRRFTLARDTGTLLDRLDSGPRLAGAGRALLAELRDVPRRPWPLADALTRWIAAEAAGFEAPAPARSTRLAFRARDGALIALAAVPALAILGG